MINVVDARAIGERAEQRRADAAHAKREAEENSRDESDAAGEQLLCVNENRGNADASTTPITTVSAAVQTKFA